MSIRKFTMKSTWSGPVCFTPYKINPKSFLCTFQWRNRTKHNFKLNLLATITFDRRNRFQFYWDSLYTIIYTSIWYIFHTHHLIHFWYIQHDLIHCWYIKLLDRPTLSILVYQKCSSVRVKVSYYFFHLNLIWLHDRPTHFDKKEAYGISNFSKGISVFACCFFFIKLFLFYIFYKPTYRPILVPFRPVLHQFCWKIQGAWQKCHDTTIL